MNRPLSKRAQGMTATNPTQNIQTLKSELNKLGPMIQNLPAQLDAVNQLVSDIETQVQSLEQMRANVEKQQQQMKQQTQQAEQAGQPADDADDFKKWIKLLSGKTMAKLEELFGGKQKLDEETENAVAGVRGEAELPGVVKTSKNEKTKKEEILHDDVLHGGKGDGVPESKLNKKELEMGQEVEMEHTNNPELAREIARDHLSEELQEGKKKKDQKYYTKLKQIHEDKCKDGVPAFWRKNLDYGSR